MSRQGALEDERGFTLVEVMLLLFIMGIVFAIASSTWFGVVESRRVDSATNQLAADLRQAHTRATNRLEALAVDLTAGSSRVHHRPRRRGPVYLQIGCHEAYRVSRRTDDRSCADLQLPLIRARRRTAADHRRWTHHGSPPTTALHATTIEINPVTSRIQVDPVDCFENEAGYSLVEVMVSIMILAIAILPMVGMFDMGLNAATKGSNYDKARTLANLKLEQAKSLPFGDGQRQLSVSAGYADATTGYYDPG